MLGRVDVGSDGVFVLTELSSQTQVLEKAEQELASLFSANHVVVLGILFL